MDTNHQHNLVEQIAENFKVDYLKLKIDKLLQDLEENDIEAALQTINELNELNGQNFYQIIGKLTRGLHDAVADLSIPTSSDQPENNTIRVDLNYVIDLTEEAAHKTLDMTEQAKLGTQQIIQNNTDQSDLIEGFLKEKQADAETAELLQQLLSLSQSSEQVMIDVNKNISEIVVAQNFQDIASQSINKALGIIRSVESSLVSLTQYANLLRNLSLYSSMNAEDMDTGSSEKLKSDLGQLNEMGEAEPEHLNQDEVDNLLSSLGF